MDLNGVYYPVYESAFDNTLSGRSPLTYAEIDCLAELTGVNIRGMNTHSRKLQAQISFDRPEESPILDGIRNDKSKYDIAVALIELGAERLKKTPRGDIESKLVPCERHAAMLEKYNVKVVMAYNAAFDTKGLNTTQRYLTKSAYRWFLPYGIKVECIWHMACQTICSMKRYYDFCHEYGFVSKSGNIQTSAEVVYAFLTNNPDFEEEHKGLDDVLIETAIFAECRKKHKKMNRNINRACWRIPQRKI
jgi:hypothetical protein